MSSSLRVFVGHSGERHFTKPNDAVTDVETLQNFVSREAKIQPRNQILLTPQGKQVRDHTLSIEHDFYVFDSARLVKGSPTSSFSSTGVNDFHPGTPPDAPSSQNDLQAWQNLFRLRRSWASGLLNGCEQRAQQAESYQEQQNVIERSLGVAVASLQQHIALAEKKLGELETWSEETLGEQHEHVSNWEANLDSLRDIPARPEFTKFIQPMTAVSSRRASQHGNVASLQGFVDAATVRKAAGAGQGLMTALARKVNKMREDLNGASDRTNSLLQEVDGITNKSWTSNTSEKNHLLDEIEVVLNKMASDLEHVQSLPRSPQSITQATKMALLHTRNYLPNMTQYCTEMNELAQRYLQRRNDAAELALGHMKTLASIETILAVLHPATKGFEAPQDDQRSFATLSMVSRLPSVYGALMIESVRRREWVAKMRRDAGTLQEELATYQDEEDKRRKKWIRSVEDLAKADALQSSVLGIELNLQNEGGSWPAVTREDLQAYHKTLLDVYGQCAVTAEMDLAIKELDKPTRKQIKHAKAFKNGSMHEAAFGDTSLMLRGDDQHKTLRESNARLDEELRGQKSRVRKLEDLLHRQTHIGRASSGDMFSPGGSTLNRNVSSPVPPEERQRKNSMQHNRRPSLQVIEEKELAKRVVDLEAELQTAMEEASSRKNSDAVAQRQVEEATSTKKDLMENMEAQQREFATERRGLEKDLAETKERVEELENEIERLMGSRDDERTGTDTRIADFEQEIARLRDDSSGHAARAATESDARRATEERLELAERARDEATSQLLELRAENESRLETDAEILQILATAHSHLSPGTAAPTGFASLASALELLTQRSATHEKDLQEAVAFAKSENESLWSSNEKQKSELAEITHKHATAEKELRQLRDRSSSEEAKASSLEQQLHDEQEQLRNLRSKFAEGETGSEVLRQRVAEEEARAGKLFSELAEARSHINSLDVEIMRLDNKHRSDLTSAEVTSERLAKRAERAKDISQRLFAQNTRLSRLLERLGLAVSYQDDTMVVERASKLGASTVMIDPHSSMNRTISLTSPPPTRTASRPGDSDLSILRWADAASAEDEASQYEAFSQHLARFDIDTFSEAIVKRVRDFEYTARKYNKEAKESGKRAEAYKERSIKTRNEAHGKIAARDFKEGDLALFLPTRGQAKGAWAAFNVGCPHYFLAERNGMRLGSRDFILARISRIEQRVVDLSKTLPAPSSEDPADDQNPFELSDGLTWWMVHATEERGSGGIVAGLSGAPTTPGLGKSTVAAANVDARGSIRVQRGGVGANENASRTLNRSLDSRRSSGASSKRSFKASGAPVAVAGGESKPMPASAGVEGLGITTDGGGAQPSPLQQDQLVDDSVSSPVKSPTKSPIKSSAKPIPQPRSASRASSPSKSVRSLQRHLDPSASSTSASSPKKAPVVSQKRSGGQDWTSLWEGEFVVEGNGK